VAVDLVVRMMILYLTQSGIDLVLLIFAAILKKNRRI